MNKRASTTPPTPHTQEALVAWYERIKRPLPWRKTRDPYAIWISEIMSQQTRVDTVIPYYERWMARFPTVYDLAQAPLEDVFLLWEGLGYYRRARHLHAAAHIVVHQWNGQLPTTSAELRKLPGIGPYTASAIASIAFEEQTPALDGNMIRVMSRVYAEDSDISKPATTRHFRQLAAAWTQHPHPGTINQALMELGATTCTPRTPSCERCPLQTTCQAAQNGNPEAFPVKTAKARQKKQHLHAWVLERPQDQAIFLGQRQDHILLGGLWEFPLLNHAPSTETFSAIGDLRHLFTHIDLRVTIWMTQDIEKHVELPPMYQQGQWVKPEHMRAYPQSTLMKKMYAQSQNT